MVELANQLPQGYQHSLAPRVQRARQRVEVIAGLKKALLEPTSEGAIVKAWRRVQRKKCQEIVPEDYLARITLAERRVTLLEAPVIADGFRWWKIRTTDAQEGFTIDRFGGERMLTPAREFE